MRIVIDIDEDYYELIKHEVDVMDNDITSYKLIAKGTPLNEVLNKIKSEIYFLPRELPTDARNMVRRTRVLDIIDKYLAESEG